MSDKWVLIVDGVRVEKATVWRDPDEDNEYQYGVFINGSQELPEDHHEDNVYEINDDDIGKVEDLLECQREGIERSLVLLRAEQAKIRVNKKWA